jgi:predicted Zn finger-like uncharacterized protein
MKIRCPKCDALYRISSKKIPPQGARATCKNCGNRFEIPGGMVTAPVAREISETHRIVGESDAPPPPPPPPPKKKARQAAPELDPKELLNDLLIHQNNLSNLRQQASQSGSSVPRFVSAGIDRELKILNGIEENLRKVLPPLQVRLRRLPEPGEPDGEERLFTHFPVLMGRSTVCDWTLDNTQVSQFHARIIQLGNQILMEDLGSTNGGAIIRDGSLLHRFQPRMGADQLQPEVLPLQERDLIYVASTRVVIEELGPDLAGGPASGKGSGGFGGPDSERII